MNLTVAASAVTILLACVIVHEAGHALALRRFGVPIEAAGLGLPYPPMHTIQPHGRRTFSVTFSPWLVGAYIVPDRRYEPHLQRMRYWDAAWVDGVGVVANLALAAFAATMVSIYNPTDQWGASAFAVCTVLTWMLRRLLAAFVLPAAGVFIAAALTVETGIALIQHQPISPTGLDDEILQAAASAHGWFICALISTSIAVINMLPIWPLDGGRIADGIIRETWGNTTSTWFRKTSAAAAAVLVAAITTSEILWRTT